MRRKTIPNEPNLMVHFKDGTELQLRIPKQGNHNLEGLVEQYKEACSKFVEGVAYAEVTMRSGSNMHLTTLQLSKEKQRY